MSDKRESLQALSDFERGRQERETRNEAIVDLLRGSFLLATSIAHITVPLLFGLSVPSQTTMLTIEAIALLVSIVSFFGFRLKPAYRWWRKYAIATFDLSLVTALALAFRVDGPPLISLMVPIPAFILMVILAGLRYSTRVVLLEGFAGAVLHLFLAATGPTEDFKILVMVFGLLLITTATAGVAYLVSSLIGLHGESISKERFRRFLAPEVVDEIMQAPAVTLGASEKDVTVLFSDITGFTHMSSSMSPQEVVGLLNDYFPVMAEIVFRQRGTLEKYIGDALMVIWGAPLHHPDDAQRAVRAALEMQAAVEELNRRWAEAGKRTIQVHIGIHSGKVAAGNIGSDAYLQYATIGDTTNVASRICSTAGAGQILISATTLEKLVEASFQLEQLPPAHVKGKDAPLDVYLVRG
jgi:class 3 adenylate cyclase